MHYPDSAHSQPPHTGPDAATEAWLTRLTAHFSTAELALLRRACALVAPHYTGQYTLTGSTLLTHAMGAADILIGMRMDAETIAATLLHALPEFQPDWRPPVERDFGANIALLVEGIARMEQIRQFSEVEHIPQREKGSQAQQSESLRQLLLAMVQDIRVVLIKLAERTQTLRQLSGATPEQQQRIARETRGIFAPLANRLGVWQIKWELEDLALRYLEPQLYKEIARLLDEKRESREQYIAEVIALLRHELEQAGIRAQVSGRPKHIYSIVNKMRCKNLEFSQLYDVRGLRILVEEVKDCYAALGLVHHLWQPIPGEFDDYIARPKSNGYRSLHTAVIGPRGLAVEIQIRTHEMHHTSELGVAAHWRYKEGGKQDSRLDEKIAWLRQILAWKDEVSSGELLEHFKGELFHDKVFVLTPQGKVIDLPWGATPVDFAYAVHTELGHRTRGAKVDGSIVPLNTPLMNGQRVEILTAKVGAPSRDWLNPALGYLKTANARSKVRHWFRQQNFEADVSAGRSRLERELQRAGATSLNLERLAQRLRFHRPEDLLAAIGRGEVSEHQLALAIQGMVPPKPVATSGAPVLRRRTRVATASSGVMVEGMGNLFTSLAKCCKPAPPDAIIGYITRERGITIHRQNCSCVAHLPEERRARLLAAHWGGGSGFIATVDIEVEAHDRRGLLRDISELFTREGINATKANTLSRNNRALMQFGLEVTSLDQLERLLGLIRQVPSVIAARRRGDHH